MREVAGFSVGRELCRTGLGRVCMATGDGRAAFVVKLCEPDLEVLGERNAAREIREFIQRAEVNRAIGEEHACVGRWARVYHLGRTDRGAAYVLDAGTLGTASQLIDGRVALDGVALAHVVGEVVEALRDLEKGLKRGHGLLKPSNVLLCGDADKGAAGARVILADAAVLAADGEEASKVADLRAVGELIHGLVLHTPFKGGWPIENSPAWRALGKEGAAWRELVNVLLDPNPKAARPGLDELAAKIAPLRIPKKSKAPMWAGIAAAVLLLGAVGGVAWHYTHREHITIVKWLEKPEQHAAEWRELCEAYRGWYSLFQAGLGKPPTGGLRTMGFATRREAYAAVDPQLKELLSLPGIADGFDPWSIAHVGRDVELGVLSATPTDHARSDEGIEKTEKARAAVGALKKGLAEGWEAPQKLKQKASEYRGHGWTKAALALEKAATDVNPDKAADPAQAVDSVLGVAAVVGRVDASWAKVQDAVKDMGAAGDEVLGRFASESESIVGAGLSDGTAGGTLEDLGTLDKQAAAGAELAGQLAAFVKAKWAATDTESFTASEEYGRLRTQAPTAETFSGWLALAKQHPALDPATDPRRTLDAGPRIAAIDADVSSLTGVPMRGKMDAAVADRIGKVKGDASAIAPDKVQWKRTTQERLTRESARLDGELKDLKGKVEGLIAARRAEIVTKAGETKTALRGKNEVVRESAAINGAWRAWRDRTLAAFKDEDYAETADAAARVQRVLEDVNTKDMPPALAKEGADVPQMDWAGALADVSAGEREWKLSSLLADAGGKPVDLESAGFRTAVRAAGNDFGAWVAKLAQVRMEIGKAEEALDSGRELTGPASIEAVVDKWMADPIGKNADVLAAISGIRERVAETRALRAITDSGNLTQKVIAPEGGKAERALAAWRRLGDQDVGWPRTKGEFEKAKGVKDALDGVIATLPEARRGAMKARAEGDMRVRWARYAAGVKDAASLEGALLAMGDFGVKEDDLLGSLKYNAMVWRLRKDLKPDTGDAGVAKMIGDLDANVRKLNAQVAAAPVVARFLKDAGAIAQGDDLKKVWVDARTLGPGKLGGRWTASINPEAGELSFTRGSTTLMFVRIQLKDGGDGEAVYLSTRELSIGDAAEILDAGGAGAAQAFAQTLPDLKVWRGPRGWNVDGRGAVGVQAWIRPDSNMSVDVPGYAPGINAAGEIAKVQAAAGGEPQRDTPLQNIPPESLALLARYAGCRFLTGAEWKAAHAMFDGGSTPAGSNLRDVTFTRQRDYVETARRTPGLKMQDAYKWPDDGVFLPEERKKQVKLGSAAQARPENDGVLWFVPAHAGGGTRVHHLVGNVSELVADNWKAFETVAPTGVNALLNPPSGEPVLTFQIIGGSALSAPEVPVDEALPVDMFDAGEGFADVGCRLAFDATGTPPPRQSYASRLARLLAGDVYLLSK